MASKTKIALITGASSGFGLLIAVALASKGYRVVATMRNPEQQSQLMQESERVGVCNNIEVVQLDVTDDSSIAEAVAHTIDKYGRIDALVNNAGFAVGGVIEEVPMEAWRAQLETNFFGLVAVTRAVLPHMRSQREGAVIQIGSVSGKVGLPGYGAYASSKFAIEGFSESLRHEVAPFGIRVYIVEPGAYRTSIWSKGFANMHTQPNSPYERQLNAVLHFSRKTADTAPPPQEVADLVARLASQKSQRRLRYPVGHGSRLLIVAGKLLPWLWIEAAVRKVLKPPTIK
ncbi:SDR family oxidoreductase [Cohnella soli]|uniref:SDR family oxidoreductase n=1 Tax=Cohnella soli TaxID=425005 RepID=A0ABW0HYE4_9BACL